MGKIISLQYVRTIASLLVLWFHVLQRLNIKPFGDFFLSGGYAVDLFFVLSGFIIYKTCKDNENWKSFAIRRILRIYPLYLSLLVLFVLYFTFFHGKEFSTSDYIQNILMLPYDGPLTTKSLIIGPAWSTCFEVYFYTIFTILLLFSAGKKYIVFLLLILMAGINVVKRMDLGGLNQVEFFQYIHSIAGAPHILNFILGILLAFGSTDRNLSKLIIKNKSAARVLFIVIQLLFVYEHLVKYDIKISLIVTTLFFMSWLHVDKIFTIDYSGKVSRFITYLGDISFSIYLTHILVIDILLNYLGINNVYLLLLSATVAAIALSAVTYKYIEVPFIDMARNLTKRKPVVENIGA